MIQVLVRAPTWTRFRTTLRDMSKQSVLRCLEYERMSMAKLRGRVLDLGGGTKTNYSDRVPAWGEGDYVYESANIDERTRPTYLIEAGGVLPVQNGIYDAVISLNTFEHIFDLAVPLTEAGRVLVPGGRLVFIVPFIFRVHGHPDDYHRGTPHFWLKTLERHGFQDVQIEVLSWGPHTAASTISGLPGPFKGPRRRIAAFLDVVHSTLRKFPDTRMCRQDQADANTALGYFVEARKPE